ncbi:MAG: hypothetical protein JKY56_26650 [Kofleriaceae bacterium]|nr:hypothetical protein [Kofleriaceae bacterium]
MRSWASLMVVGLSACAFDTSNYAGPSDGGTQTPIAVDSAPINAIDAVTAIDSGPPPAACSLYGTENTPIAFLGQINTLTAGRYYFAIDGKTFEGEVSVDEGGDSWLMVLNYLHRSGSNPNLTVYSDRLPVLSGASLGSDESGTLFWGHSSNELFASLAGEELRFFGLSGNHNRVMHFRTKNAATVDYFKSGQGSAQGLRGQFEPYTDHTTELPASQDNRYTNQGDEAQTNFPFYRFGSRHWAIRGGSYRWEVDDYNGGAQPDTLHRIWVRSQAICGNGLVEGNEVCDDGNQLSGDGCGCCIDEGN